MENNPKKSKALIITIILILLLLVAGYFIFKNNSFFGVKSSTNTELNSLPPSNNSQGFFSKIFAPLTTSSNSKSLATGQNGNIGNAEAGEDIAQGDSVYKFGVNKSNFPVVKKIDPKNTNKFGTSLGNYKTGQLGSFLITDKSFWGKIKDWVGGIFGYNPADNKCANGATNYPLCNNNGTDLGTFPNVIVSANPMFVSSGQSSTVTWSSTNTTSCNAGAGNGIGTSGSFSTGPLTASKSFTVICNGPKGASSGNVLITVGTAVCINNATNPPECTTGVNKCTNGADNFPTCTTLNGACLNGATNPEACTTGEDNMPSVTVTATPQTITYGGTSSISWKSENTTACTLSGGGITGTGTTNSGVSTGKLTKDMSYTVKCTRANESTSGTVFVTVELNKFPSVQIEANPETIPYNGSSTISWTSTNAVSCAASVPIDTVEGGESVSTTNGSFSTGALTESRSYVVSCEGLPGTGSSSATVLVFVNPEIIPIVPECRDGISNNDNDTLVDSADPECHKDGNPKNNDSYDPDWYSESVPWGYKPQCSDGIDNDWDRLIDIQDPNCHTDGIALDNNASRGTAGLVDENGQSPVETYNAKTYDPNILSESGSAPAPVGYTECSDGKENDGDEKIDINDPQCHIGGKMEGLFVPTHDSESISPKQCDDTIDNDRDHKKDIDDEGCHTNGILGEPYIPLWNDEETPPSACNDGIDNDGDWKIDIQDPQCHIDGKLENEYVPTNSSELDAPMSPNICLDIEQNPITFTDEEKARLAVLLRKFYLISSTLRTSEDISTIYNEIDQQNNFMDQIDGLSKQCYLQTKDSYGFNNFCIRNPKSCDTNFLAEFEAEANTKYNDSFYGTRTSDLAQDMRHGNPWYQPSYQYHNPSGAFPYSRTGAVAYTDYNWLEGNYEYNINGTYSSARVQQTGNYYSTGDGPGCKAVSGYYYGTLVEDVSFINPPIPIGSDTNQEGDYEYQVTSGTRGASCYDLFNKFAFQYCTTANSTQNKCSGNNIKTRYTSQSCSNMSTKIFGTMKAPPREELLKAGCKWKDGVILENAERILNIW